MAAPKADEYEEESEDWLVTYADAITLLMAFFVMLLTFAEFDIPAYEELTSALASNIGKREEQSTTQSLKIDVQDMVYSLQADQVVDVSTDEKGVVIELQSGAFFQPASADIKPAALPVLAGMAETMASARYELYNIVVEGHTDDGAISTARFPSNWELSAGRASTVVRLFETSNVDRMRLTASGHADTRPKVPNRDLEGKPIPENRATNRRVVLRLHPMSLDERDAYLTAQRIKEEQEEAKRRAEAAKPKPVEERLPLQATPETLSEEQRQIKLAIDNVIRSLYTAGANNQLISGAALDAAEGQMNDLSVARDADLEPFFSAVETFIQNERASATAIPATN